MRESDHLSPTQSNARVDAPSGFFTTSPAPSLAYGEAVRASSREISTGFAEARAHIHVGVRPGTSNGGHGGRSGLYVRSFSDRSVRSLVNYVLRLTNSVYSAAKAIGLRVKPVSAEKPTVRSVKAGGLAYCRAFNRSDKTSNQSASRGRVTTGGQRSSLSSGYLFRLVDMTRSFRRNARN